MRPNNCTVADTKTARTSPPSKGDCFKVKYAHIVEARWREHRVRQRRLENAPEHTSCPTMHNCPRIGVPSCHESTRSTNSTRVWGHQESNPRCPAIACPDCGNSFPSSGTRTYCLGGSHPSVHPLRESDYRLTYQGKLSGSPGSKELGSVPPPPFGGFGKNPAMIAERQVYELERAEIAKGAMGTALVVVGSVAIVERSSLSDRVSAIESQRSS